MPAGDFIRFGLASLVFGIIGFANGFRLFKRKQMIENIPTSKVRSLAMGLAEVQGEAVVAKKELKSPFTNKNCVYYRYEIDEYRSSKNGGYWARIKDGIKHVPFYLKDNTGMVLVDPKDAHVDIPKDWRFQPSLFKSSPKKKTEEKIKSFFKKEKISYTGFFGFKRNLRFTEYYIAPRDKIFVLGTAGDNPHKKEASAKKSLDDIMMQQGENEKFYYITDRHQKKILGDIGWKTNLSLIGGGVLIVFGIGLILLSLGI